MTQLAPRLRLGTRPVHSVVTRRALCTWWAQVDQLLDSEVAGALLQPFGVDEIPKHVPPAPRMAADELTTRFRIQDEQCESELVDVGRRVPVPTWQVLDIDARSWNARSSHWSWLASDMERGHVVQAEGIEVCTSHMANFTLTRIAWNEGSLGLPQPEPFDLVGQAFHHTTGLKALDEPALPGR